MWQIRHTGYITDKLIYRDNLLCLILKMRKENTLLIHLYSDILLEHDVC